MQPWMVELIKFKNVNPCSRLNTAHSHACATFHEASPSGSRSIMHKKPMRRWPLTLIFNRLLEVAKLYQAKCSGSWTIVSTEKRKHVATMLKTILPLLSQAVKINTTASQSMTISYSVTNTSKKISQQQHYEHQNLLEMPPKTTVTIHFMTCTVVPDSTSVLAQYLDNFFFKPQCKNLTCSL